MGKLTSIGILIFWSICIAGCSSNDQQSEQQSKAGAENVSSEKGSIVKSFEDRLQSCLGCHDDHTGHLSSNYPYLDGQYQGYLVKQLRDMRIGSRRNWTMRSLAQGLSDDDIDRLAKYFSDRPRKFAPPSTDQAAIKAGRKIYMEGNPNSQIAACKSCHGAKGEGDGSMSIPALIGQKPSYIQMQLFHMKNINRAHFPESPMLEIGLNISNEEIVAVSEYISTLR